MLHDVVWSKHGVYIKKTEELLLDDTLRVSDEVIGDPRFDDLKYVVFDATEVTKVVKGDLTVTLIAARDASASTYSEYLKMALVGDHPDLIELYDEYIGVHKSLSSKWDIKKFPTLEGVEDWVKEEADI